MTAAAAVADALVLAVSEQLKEASVEEAGRKQVLGTSNSSSGAV